MLPPLIITRTDVLAGLLATLASVSANAQHADRLELKDGRHLVGSVRLDRADLVEFLDQELGAVLVPRPAIRWLWSESTADYPRVLAPETAAPEPSVLAELPTPGFVRLDDGKPAALRTAVAKLVRAGDRRSVLLVGCAPLGEAGYFDALQRMLDSCDRVLAVTPSSTGAATLSRLAALERPASAIDTNYRDWQAVDLGPAHELGDLAINTPSRIDTDVDVITAASIGDARHRLANLLVRGSARPDPADIEPRITALVRSLDTMTGAPTEARRIAILDTPARLPAIAAQLVADGWQCRGVGWFDAFVVRPPATTADLEALRSAVAAAERDGVRVSAWIGDAAGVPVWSHASDATRAAASAIKTAYLVELFASRQRHLDQPLPGADAILHDADHPALAHFDASQREEIRRDLRGASVRDLGRAMIHGIGVSNVVYNAAANLVTAHLGGPAELSRRLTERFGTGAAVRRYMLARRDVDGDNEATAEFFARVLCRIADGRLRGVEPATVDAIRAVLFRRQWADGTRLLTKGGALPTHPMVRIQTGIRERPGQAPVIYAVVCERDRRAGDPSSVTAGLAAICERLTAEILAAAQ